MQYAGSPALDLMCSGIEWSFYFLSACFEGVCGLTGPLLRQGEQGVLHWFRGQLRSQARHSTNLDISTLEQPCLYWRHCNQGISSSAQGYNFCSLLPRNGQESRTSLFWSDFTGCLSKLLGLPHPGWGWQCVSWLSFYSNYLNNGQGLIFEWSKGSGCGMVVWKPD